MKPLPTKKPIEYPDSDGKPMAENTVQYRWLVTIKENLEAVFANNPEAFIAGDLLWYPVEGRPDISQAPDVMVALGRPKGDRGSYKQWEEEGIAPQVVFEILSPSNRPSVMLRKFKFYEGFGVDEYYLYDPDLNELTGWLRNGDELTEITAMNGWTSPRLGVRFECHESLTIRKPDGKPFLTVAEIIEERDRSERAREQAERDIKLSDWERSKAIAEREQERVQKEKAITEREQAQAEKDRALAEIAELRARLQAFEKP
jgi:Uma2 family endonuclease